jgi:hypothetical protein
MAIDTPATVIAPSGAPTTTAASGTKTATTAAFRRAIAAFASRIDPTAMSSKSARPLARFAISATTAVEFTRPPKKPVTA